MAETHARRQPNLDPARACLRRYRSILFWPLSYSGAHNSPDPDGPWCAVPDRLRYLDADPSKPCPDDRVQAYQELVYFHGYVQQALYGSPTCNGIRLFAHSDIKAVAVDISDKLGARTIDLSVDRLHLYRAGRDIAVLVCEVSADESECVTVGETHRRLTLADSMSLSDHFRRAYPPFFDEAGCAGLAPRSVQWGGHAANPAMTSEAACAHVTAHRAPPVFDHWLEILPASMTEAEGPARRLASDWRHLVDERMPNMTYLALESEAGQAPPACRLSQADLARLAAVDEYAPHAPYSDAQMTRDLADQTYDRFAHWGTLYLVSGYGFTVLGADPDPNAPFFESVVRNHFRRHYFQMGLMLQIEAASYLALSNRVSRAVGDGLRGEARRKVLVEAQEALLELNHRYRFTGISNHVQGRELFTLWRRLLGNNVLLQDLGDELEAGAAFLRAEKQEREGRVAGRFTVLGAAFGLLGLAGLMKAPAGADAGLILQVVEWRHFLVCLALGLGAGALASLGLETPLGDRLPRGPWFRRVLLLAVGASAVALSYCWLQRVFGP